MFLYEYYFSKEIFISNQKPVAINKLNSIYSRNYNRCYSQCSIHLTTIFYSFIDYFCLVIKLRFCAGSNPARGVSEIPDGEDL